MGPVTDDHLAPPPFRRSPLRPAAAGVVWLLIAPFVAVGCGEVPRDPNGTLHRVRGGTMRVGVVEHRPWTTVTPRGAAAGLEGALAAELARELGAKIEWVRATEPELFEALELRELDLVIGGLTDASPWKQHVAFTKPFYTDTIVIGAPFGAPRMRSLDGRTVFYRASEPAVAAYIREKGGVPRAVAELGDASGLVAAATWQLASLALAPTGITLHTEHHVMAAPPGENAWLSRIERSIRTRKAAIPEVLRTTRP
jgi:polar amino acid transport system substrate-binding protein